MNASPTPGTRDVEEDGDELVLHSSRGWSLDRDGWWSRASHARDRISDATLNPRLFPHGVDCHVIVADGRVLCRDARQKRAIDNSRFKAA